MATWKGKTRGNVAGHRFFIFLLKNAGLSFSYFFLRFVVLYFVLFVPAARKPIYHYFHKILGYSPTRSCVSVFRNFYKLGQVLLDKVAMLAGIDDRFTFDFEGEKYLHQMAETEGGFLIGAHIGNWEIAGQLLERIKKTVHIVMLEAEHQKIKELLDSVMTKKNISVIPVKEDMSHLLLINKAISNNELVAIHGDRFIEGSKTLSGTFLGHQALFPFGPFYMAARYNKPVTFVSAAKETDTHYHFYATKPLVFDEPAGRKNMDNRISHIFKKYLAEMERILKMYPEQWFNYYYFWSQPE